MPHKFVVRVLVLLAWQLLLPVPAPAQPAPAPETVVLQLKWLHAFQFAGYYAAKEKGYYADEGLSVDIRERVPGVNNIEQVLTGEAQYGVADTSLLLDRLQGKPLVLLASIFQHNPLVYITLKNSGIVSPYEMVGKRVMSDPIDDAPLVAMLHEAGISRDKFTRLGNSFNADDLIDGKTDVVSGYLTDQVDYFKRKGVAINIIDPRNYGVDFLGDNLFTTEGELRENPERAERFRRASIKGWEYALRHPDELIRIILDKYDNRHRLSAEHLAFEARETAKMILPETIPIGSSDAKRFQRMVETYQRLGLAAPSATLDGFIYAQDKPADLQLAAPEKAWLRAHPTVRVGIDRDFAPYEWLDAKGNYVGLAADYLVLVEQRLGVKFDIVKDKSWADMLDMARRGELDMIACIVKTPERDGYLLFTEPYAATPAGIIDDGSSGYIGTLARLSGKRVAVVKGYFMQELLARDHPDIRLVVAADERDALRRVAAGEADAYVGDAASANYVVQRDGLLTLRLSGQTEYQSRHSMAVTRANPELAGILGKALDSIPKSEKEAIHNRWMGLKAEAGIDKTVITRYVVGVGALLLLFGYWNLRLRREIVDRQKVEDELRLQKDFLQAIFDNEPECVKVLALDGKLLRMNQAGLDMLEVNGLEEIEGHGLTNFVRPNYRAAFTDLNRRVFAGATGALVFPIEGMRGTRRWMETHATPLRDTQGKVVALLGVTRDITERRRMEQEIVHRTEELEKAKEAAEAANNAKSQFLSNMSHELRTPLNAIIGFSQVLLGDPDNPLGQEQSQYITEVHKAGEHLLDLITDILDLSRIDTGQVEIGLDDMPLAGMLADCHRLIQSAAATSGVSVFLDMPPAEFWIKANPVRLRQVLLNLLSNAVKYNRKDGMVRIGAAAHEGRVRIVIEDTGLGMASEQLPELFEPFNRLGREASGIEGTGIGLTITKRLVEAMNGSIAVKSQAGVGSRFYVSLPISAPPGKATATAPASSATQESMPPVGERLRILYIEDNPVNMVVMRAMLAKLGHGPLMEADSGEHGIETALREAPDAVFLDINLPGISGYETLQRLRSHPETRDIPVVAVTANATSMDLEKSRQSNFFAYVTKPFSLAMLQDVLERLRDCQSQARGLN